MKEKSKKGWDRPRVERYGTFAEVTQQSPPACKMAGGNDGTFNQDGLPGSCS